MSDPAARNWWESPGFDLALVLAAAIPLLLPEVPPLVDVPGHMGRYKVELDLAGAPTLQQFYNFSWAITGNLGGDLLVIPLTRLMGLEAAVKLICVLIPCLTVAGFLWVAREVHGRVPPTALFAVPLAWNFPLHYGFLNFTLAMALCFLAFGLWLRLAKLGRFRLRAALFVPLSSAIWLAHTFGWASLAVMGFSAELVRQHDKGGGWWPALVRTGVQCLSLATPILLMILWRSGNVEGDTTGFFKWIWKLKWIAMALRDRWLAFDAASFAVIGALILWAIRSRRLTYSRNLAASALIFAIVFALLPRKIFGSFYADMRLVPYMLAIAVIGIRLREGASRRFAATIAAAALAFILVRTAATTVSLHLFDRDYDRELAAVEHIPHGARLLSLVGRRCGDPWPMVRNGHLPAMALVRKEAFSNDQWTTAGAQLLSIAYAPGGFFVRDPTQYVTATPCPHEKWLSLNQTLARFPRTAFDYVWMIEPPAHDPRLLAGLRPIWRSGSSVLYVVADREPVSLPGEAE